MSLANKNLLRSKYTVNIEKASIIALLLVILLFLLFPRIKIRPSVKAEKVITSLTVENIPITRQSTPGKPPPKPVVPIPSEDDLIPDDVTIEDTELTFERLLFSSGQGAGDIIGSLQILQPRPIFEVIPEYSEELQKKGIQGVVKLHLHIDQSGQVIDVMVLENSSGSDICANAARSAALKGRYLPAKKNGAPIDLWITRTYTFGLQK